jgi:NADPH-dependent glutamate synthase beta subunit-like oxidoreductase/ferredoxin
MDIPHMLRAILAGDLAAAARTARAALVLPASLGRICPAPCEKGCRRAQHDAGLAIRGMHRYAADADLGSRLAALPDCAPATGKHVAVIGAGPAGLAAAWHLLQEGHGVAVFDDHDAPGGMLRYGVPVDELPRAVLDAETALVRDLGAEFRLGVRVGRDVTLEDLARDFDAVLVACGKTDAQGAAALGVPASARGVQADKETLATSLAGVFAAGDAVLPRRMAVRAVADGAQAARAIAQYLAGEAVTPSRRPFTTRLGRPTEAEMAAMLAAASAAPRVEPAGGAAAGLSAEEATREAARCLHCDCRKADVCRLRRWSDALDAQPARFSGTRRPFELHTQHDLVVYEPGKCIACGLCIQIAAREKEPLGLAFIGRGFNVRVGVPFNETIAAGLRRTAEEVILACPTGALARKDA